MSINQKDFDLMIGSLDRILSEMAGWARNLNELDEANKQTLKHHADDMMIAAESIMNKLRPKEEQDFCAAPAPCPPQHVAWLMTANGTQFSGETLTQCVEKWNKAKTQFQNYADLQIVGWGEV